MANDLLSEFQSLNEKEQDELLNSLNDDELSQLESKLKGTQESTKPQEPTAQEKPESLMERFGKWIPTLGAIGGGFAGGALGSGVLSLPAGVAGAAAGAAAGKGLQEALYAGTEALYPGTISKPQTTAQKLYEPAIEAGTQILGGKALQGAGAVLKSSMPALKKLAVQILRVGPAIPEQAGKQIVNDPTILSRALPIEEAKTVFGNWVKKMGYKYDVDAVAEIFKGKITPSSEAVDKIKFKVLDQIDDIENLEPYQKRELIQKALAVRTKLSDKIQGLLKNPEKASETRYHTIEFNKIDDFLDKSLPGFDKAKQTYNEAMLADAFKSWLPLNKNLSPNVLRSWSALGLATHGISEGNILPSMMLPAVSPRMAGYAIKGATGLSNLGSAISQTGIPQAGYRGGVSMISDMINKAFEKYSRSAPGPR